MAHSSTKEEKVLRTILDTNPFNDHVMCEWKQALEEFDRGIRNFGTLDFSLSLDRAAINETRQAENTKWQVLPHPFLGDPRAKIWILNINPGFCVMDYFDCLTVDGFDSIVQAERNFVGKRYSDKDRNACRIITEEIGVVETEEENLIKRRESVLKQMQLSTGSFSYLEECFRHNGLDRHRAIYGGYEWWRRTLFGKRDRKKEFIGNINAECPYHEWASKRIFNIEFFPYHSSSFDSDALDLSKWGKSAYYPFWRELLAWAVQDDDRVFIVRSPEKFMALLNNDANCANKIVFPHGYLVLRNRRNPWFSISNIESERLSLKEIDSPNEAQGHIDNLTFYREWFKQYKIGGNNRG